MKKILSYAMNKGEIPMKKAIAFLTCCAVFPLCSGTVANSAESDNAENKIKVTFNDYMNMEDEEFSEFFNLSEYYFGDDSVDDAVKFEKYLNTPPSYYNGDNWISEKYCAYKQFISGEAEPYVCFSTDEYIETVDFTPMDLGYPSDWEIEGYNGKWVVELADGTIYSKDINQYRLHVPVEVIADFETYVRLDVSKSYFNEIENNTLYGITLCRNIGSQFLLRGEEGYELPYIRGDANNDKIMTIADAAAVMQSLANPDKYALSEQGEFNADFACDGITVDDAVEIQKKLASIA